MLTEREREREEWKERVVQLYRFTYTACELCNLNYSPVGCIDYTIRRSRFFATVEANRWSFATRASVESSINVSCRLQDTPRPEESWTVSPAKELFVSK